MYVPVALTSLKEARKRAKRGAKLLDKKKPNWWKRATIQTRRLNLVSDCVLGQVFAKDAADSGTDGFEFGAIKLFPEKVDVGYEGEPHQVDSFSTKACDDYGFDAPRGNDAEYALLGQAWLEEIKARRQVAKVAMFRKIHKRKRPLTAYEKQCCVNVAKGARLLNKRLKGWAFLVKLTDLDLRSTEQCVLGQLAVQEVLGGENGYGSYSRALDALNVSGSAHGFDIGCSSSGLDSMALDYRLLDELWAEVIRCTRRGEKVSGRSLQAAMQ